jgi:RES domain-containing protein
MDSKVAQVAAAPIVAVEGSWQRHVATRYSEQALDGRRGYGRWGTKDGFSVLYLGRPTESVVIEAYRHLVDPLMDNVPQLISRFLITASVSVTNVLDLRGAAGRGHVGLPMSDLTSSTTDRDAQARCQEVAQVAHQLGRHGIIAPAATGAGDTLVLFTDLLPKQERPIRSGDDVLWSQLPPDPRNQPRLRLVRDADA